MLNVDWPGVATYWPPHGLWNFSTDPPTSDRHPGAIGPQFLRNMGVAATLTVSLVVGGQLWGMIACHDGKPWLGPFALRQDCQFLGQVTAAQIGKLAAAAVQTCRCKRTEMLAKLLEQIAGSAILGQG
jgi:chemotaxis family two-component system sensor kinase Cph1